MAIFFLSSCTSDGTLPPLPELGRPEKGDGETDPLIDGEDGLSEVEPELGDEETTVEPADDAITDTLEEEQEVVDDDVGIEEECEECVEEDATAADSVCDASEEGEAPPSDSYRCTVTAENRYGWLYAMYAETKNPVIATDGSWSGDMWFVGASGTDSVLEAVRRNNPASTWPQDGQSIPSYAQNLTGTWLAQFIKLSPTTATFSLNSYPPGCSVTSGKAILPMTSATSASLPEPVEITTSNEIYVSAQRPLEISASCLHDDVTCPIFQGTLDVLNPSWPITNPANMAGIQIFCSKF